jgi:hypothetical protein
MRMLGLITCSDKKGYMWSQRSIILRTYFYSGPVVALKFPAE